ncbi:hypothetical protein [Hyalangium minutum]|uniref:Uncharacterized protein n=1 Tax=Hyalangium minutum TaxID=394096 RepID=A0A085W9V1_9BACT|nr:hypothetical protein [Hyalangium minutum]KFE64464.1 hypothetical protein DB31_2258 [Hyalangium minutum]
MSGLALLAWLTACAAPPSRASPRWYAQAGPGQSSIEVDFEAPSPAQQDVLRQRGIRLPQSAQGLADPRAHRDFVDLRVTSVGFGISEGGWILFCEGLPLPILVPENQVDLGLTRAQPLNASIYPDREAALAELSAGGSGATRASYAYYRGADGALVVPTVFSPATTPRIARTMLEVRKDLSQTVERDLKVALLTLTGTQVLRGVFSRVVRAAPEPQAPSFSPQQGLRGEAPARPPPEPRAGPPAPEPAPAPAPPAPGRLAPSPGLVEALSGKNPTTPVAPRPRLPQDAAVSPAVPGELPRNRPISRSPSQNAQLQVDIKYLQGLGAKNIRVNQQQLTSENHSRVGINRPDLQFDYKDRRYSVEYDSPASGRGSSHQSRLTSNDPDAEIILLIVP